MRHWHEAGCTAPDVRVALDEILRCDACYASLDVAKLISEAAASGASGLDIPPDQKLGQMNLWWPPSVPYMSASHAADVRTPVVTSLPSATADQYFRTSYPRSLKSDEIRLICMTPGSYDDPVHLTLEVYNLDDCPEYETVSYTWAGEDGDGRPSKPVYVGPYWDVLPQTKNCWEMLRFVRPWRGMRLLWVDAVCINQADIAERNSQVANMANIYSAGSRVVVFLGPDVAVPLYGRHPRRRRLHELETGAVKPIFHYPSQSASASASASASGPSPLSPPSHSFKHLLKRRYFSRIWVIQELLLSQRVVIRVGDVDFWADPAMLTHFSANVPGWNWEKTRAPWVRHMTHAGSGIKTFVDLMLLSTLSQATDPRDRLFGLLGVMSGLSEFLDQDPTSHPSSISSVIRWGELRADYSLSCQHVFIGLFAFCLLRMRRAQIFYHASCRRSQTLGLPSWTPDWKSAITWSIVFKVPKFHSDEVFENMTDLIHKYEKSTQRFAGEVGEGFDLHELTGPSTPDVEKHRAWWQRAYVDGASGALHVNLTHYMTLQKEVRKIGSWRGFGAFAVTVADMTVYILSEHTLQIDKAPNWHVFVLQAPDRPKVFLILEPVSKDDFRLISACPYVLIRFRSVNRRRYSMRSIPLQDMQHSLHEAIGEMNEELDKGILYQEGLTKVRLFPGAPRLREVLPLLVKAYESIYDNEKFRDAYLPLLDPKLSPRIENGMVQLTVPIVWTAYRQRAVSWAQQVSLPCTHSFWKYGIESVDDGRIIWDSEVLSSSAYKIINKTWERGKPHRVYVQYPLFVVQSSIGNSSRFHVGLFGVMSRLYHTYRMTGEDLPSMFARDREERDRFTGCPNEEKLELWGKLGTRGFTEKVGIV